MAKDKRFKKIYTNSALGGPEIWVDLETGVNYIFILNGYGGGLTVLVDRDGKPMITNPSDIKD